MINASAFGMAAAQEQQAILDARTDTAVERVWGHFLHIYMYWADLDSLTDCQDTELWNAFDDLVRHMHVQRDMRTAFCDAIKRINDVQGGFN